MVVVVYCVVRLLLREICCLDLLFRTDEVAMMVRGLVGPVVERKALLSFFSISFSELVCSIGCVEQKPQNKK